MNSQRIAALEGPIVQVLDQEESLKLERILETSVAPLDELIGGFKSSQVTVFDSDNGYASSLLHLLCVRAISEFDEEVVWIDGGNAVDPYSISSLCKRLRFDKKDILSRVNISRAFTAYQLVSLIDERLEEEVKKSAPAMIIISSLTDLFLDKDMKWMESYQLLRRCSEDLWRITKEYETITLVTDHTPGYIRSNPRMTALLYDSSDRVVQMRTKKDGLLVRLPREDRSLLFSPVHWNQTTLDEFFRGDSYGKDGAYIPLGP